MSCPIDECPTFLIWDNEDAPPKGQWTSVLWRSYGNGDNLISIPKLVEKQAASLRKRYLAWLYDLGESRIEGKRLVDHLELRPDFSYWWMTLVAEKSNAYKSPQIVNVLKMFVLEELVRNYSVSTLTLVSADKTLAQSLRLLCKNAGFVFEWQPLQGGIEHVSGIKRVYSLLPQSVQAIIFLGRYIWQRWPLKQQQVRQDKSDGDEITFVDYLIHLNQKAFTDGQFTSNYWTDLSGILDRSESAVNWVHHYLQHEAIPSIKRARNLIGRFNQRRTGRQFHAFLDSAWGISMVLATVIDYIRLVWMSLWLKKVKWQFSPTESQLDFWPLFKQDWLNSMRGPIAIWNCLCLNLFERVTRRLPHQKLGVYLQENQGWEMALNYAWRVAGHGRLIGVAHSIIRFWDLRYFYDPHSYQRTGKNDLPLPDKVALNSAVATAAYLKGGYPANKIVEVEALRYMYMTDFAEVLIKKDNEDHDDFLKILILGDYLPGVTKRQMQWLVEAASLLPPETCYILKPHPACAVLPKDYPSLQFHVANESLQKLLAACDVAFVSNITSAAVDAYCAGVPVVSALDGKSLNMSPLRGMGGVVYVTGPKELADVLGNIRKYEGRVAKPYFCLDKELPRWKKLLMDSGMCESIGSTGHL